MPTPQIIFPNFLKAKIFYTALLESEMAREDVKAACNDFYIAGIHGQIPELCWSEYSRLEGTPHFYPKNFFDVVEIYLNTHIPLFFDFSNPLLTEEDTHDRFGNKILKDLSTASNCTIICSSPALYLFLKNNFPNFKTCWKFFTVQSSDEILEKLKEHEYVLLPTSCGYNRQILNSIPQLLRKRCIISVNDRCDCSCKYFDEHLIESSKIALMLTDSENGTFCDYFYGKHDHNGKSHKIQPIAYSEAINTLMPLGYNVFYISSIHDDLHYIKETCDFLVKDNRKLSMIDLTSKVKQGVRY